MYLYISVITTTLHDQKHISENCIGSVMLLFYFDWSPIRLHGEGMVYDLYCSQPPGGDPRARSFTFQDEWDTPGPTQSEILLVQNTFPHNNIKHQFFLLLLFFYMAFHNSFYIYQWLNSANREITNFVVAPFLMYF